MTDRTDDYVDLDAAASLDPRAAVEAAAARGDSETPTADQPAQSAQLEEGDLKQALETARRDAAASQARYLRSLADMENYKKRIERTYADLSRTAKKDLLTKLLAVKDNLER